MRLLRSLPLLVALLGVTHVSAEGKPKIKYTTFDNQPADYFYFEDSPSILSFDRFGGNVFRSDDSGVTWNLVANVPHGAASDVYQHPFDKKRAYILGEEKKHWRTVDRGKTWQSWESEVPASYGQAPQLPLVFHAQKPNFVIFHGKKCEDGWELGDCEQTAWYTKDNFDSNPKLMLKDTHGCSFARASKEFTKGTDYTVFCIIEGKGSFLQEKRRLVVSDDWFKDKDGLMEPKLDGVQTYQGIAGVAVVQKFFIVAVKGEGTSEMALFVTDDALDWARAEFPADHGAVEEDAYTILESQPYSLHVDVLTTRKTNAIGSLFSSNSNGRQFTRIMQNTNRNRHGLVDMEAIKSIEGIFIANQVKNADKVNENRNLEKIIESKISFDGGRVWSNLKTTDKEALHVHSVSDLANLGRVFSSPAPGLVMAIGNTGGQLESYDEGHLYVSDDAGLTWRRAKEGAHKYEFGDQGSILVAVFDEDTTDKISYSLDHGKTWVDVDLGVTIRARLLTTTPDNTSPKFTLVALGKEDPDGKRYYIFSLDFSDVRSRTCKMDKSGKGDFEKWYARLDEKGEPDCLMGHKQFFWRRKADADCFVNQIYKEEEPEKEICACTEEDFECDFNFVRKDVGSNECVPIKGAILQGSDKCTKPTDKFKGSSGYRLIPGNDCDRKKGKSLDGEIERDCGDVEKRPPTSGKIRHVANTFAANTIADQFYLERSDTSSGTDETIVLRTTNNEVHISHNHGETWERILKDSEIVAIYPNPYFHDMVYFITPKNIVHYSSDRGKTFKNFVAPEPPNGRQLDILTFHPLHKEYLIWTSDKGCPGPECHNVAYYTTDLDDWKSLLSYVRYCRWIANKFNTGKVAKNLIFCERYADDNEGKNEIELVASESFFTSEEVKFKQVKGFATMEEFIAVAVVNEDGTSLKVEASLDGKIFAEAKFPHGFVVPHQHAYTVLESITHAVYLHVTVNEARGNEYGAILKSNSNGTSYVMSLNNVNRDYYGYVDFEKMQGLEGVALANIVINIDDARSGAKKKYKSKITHNDGGQWAWIRPPSKDSKGESYECSGDIEKCSLHLHSYTERADKRHTFSSASAVGLMIGVGNVGSELTAKNDGDTFITRDGGISWTEIHKGAYMWEFGDQGAIIVVVEELQPTKKIKYTLNEGKTWEDYEFSDEDINVFDISTVPSDMSRKFIIWGKPGGKGDKFVATMIDFTGLTDKQCVLDPEHPDSDDFDYWKPSHPLEENGCLFGHQAEYARKIQDHLCYIGQKIPQPHRRFDNCSCTRHDFECDFNYEMQNDGTCQLIPGLPEPNHEMACLADKNLLEWYEPTGYRRIPLTTCEDGHQLDKIKSHPCPGKEDLWKKKHPSVSGVGVFFIVLLSFSMAGALGYVLWNRWSGKFGAIRLGDEPQGQSPLIRYPIIAISGLVAFLSAIPFVLGALYRVVAKRFERKPRYTTRGSFARGDYANVTNDEGELLGEDSDEEV